MNGYPKVFNIETDPHGEHNFGEMYNWVFGPPLKAMEEYKASLAKNPNPPAAIRCLFRTIFGEMPSATLRRSLIKTT